MPSCLEHTHTRIRPDHRTVITHRPRTNRHEAGQIVIVRIHLRDRARRKSVDIGDSDGGRWIEMRTDRLNRDHETRLLAKPRNHRNFVHVHWRYRYAT